MNQDSKKNEELDDDIPEEIDFSGGVRGKYAKEFHQKSNIVILDPDVAEEFPNSGAVNHALRTLLRIQKRKSV